MIRLALLAVLAATLLLAVAAPGTDRRPRVCALPDGWQPEGIAAGPGKSLYVGSISDGRRAAPEPRKTGATRVVVAPSDDRAAIGIEVAGKRIVAAGGRDRRDVFAYDRSTGADRGDRHAGPRGHLHQRRRALPGRLLLHGFTGGGRRHHLEGLRRAEHDRAQGQPPVRRQRALRDPEPGVRRVLGDGLRR